MEKRMILAIALSLAVLIGYQYFTSPPPPPPGVTAGKDNAAAVPATPAKEGAAPAAPPAAVSGTGGLAAKTVAAARTITVKTPLYSASLATEGGAISSFLLNEYKDTPGGKPLDIVGGKKALPLSLYLDEDRPPLPSPLVFASDAPAEIAAEGGRNPQRSAHVGIDRRRPGDAGVRVPRGQVRVRDPRPGAPTGRRSRSRCAPGSSSARSTRGSSRETPTPSTASSWIPARAA